MPINLPDYAFTSIDVDTDLGTKFARSEGGLIITSRRSDPFWAGPMTTQPLTGWHDDNQHAAFRAFLTDCVDRNMRVDFIHPRHRLPGAYSLDTWPMAGDARLVSVPNLRTILVADLVVGMILRQGDRISITQGDVVVHRWIASDTLVSSTLSQALPLTPRLPIGVLEADAVVVLKDPKMRFMIVPGSWKADEVANPTPITFEVSESLR